MKATGGGGNNSTLRGQDDKRGEYTEVIVIRPLGVILSI